MLSIANKIKTEVKISDLAGKTEKVGTGLLRLNPCPSCGHNDCFTINEKANTFKCFSCDQTGSVLDFVINHPHHQATDFLSAVKYLAKKYDYELKQTDILSNEHQKLNKRAEIFTASARFYHSQLKATPKALKYLKNKRHRNVKMINQAGYGFATNKSLYEHLLSLDFKDDEIVASGLCKQNNETAKIYDHFGFDLLIYPVMYQGQVSDFLCKAPKFKADSKPIQYRLKADKRLNDVLFMNQKALWDKEELILCEGQEDLFSILQASQKFPRLSKAIAILGTFSKKQLDLLKQYVTGKTVYMCFDNDAGGQKYELQTAQALIGLNVDLRHVDLKTHNDPDDFINKEKAEEFIKALDDSMDYLAYKISKLIDIDKLPPMAAKRQYTPIVNLIATTDDEIVRQGYMTILAQQLGTKSLFLPAIRNEIKKIRNGGQDFEEKTIIVNEVRLVERSANRYFKVKNKGREDENRHKIANFTLEITKQLLIEEDIYYVVVLTNSKGVSSRDLKLTRGERVNKRQFREEVAKLGSFYFSGSDDDLCEIWQLEEDRSKIESVVCYFRRYGYIKEHKVWLFANCAYKQGVMHKPNDEGIITIDGVGYVADGINIYSGDAPKLYTEEPATDEYVNDTLSSFRLMFDTPDTYSSNMIFGFLACLVYLHELTTYDKKFPYLMIYGPSGTGKTEAVLLVMNVLGFSNVGENWGEATAAGISQAMEQLSSLIYWLEEYKNPAGASNRQLSKIQIVNNIYNRSSAGKGGLHNVRQVRQVNAALMLTGQDRPADKAMLSRCFVIRKNQPSDLASENFFRLRNDRQKLSLVFRWLLEQKTAQKGKDLITEISNISDFIKKELKNKKQNIDERTVINISILAAGYSMFDNVADDIPFKNWLVNESIKDVSRKNQEDILYRFFSEIEVIFTNVYSVVLIESGVLYLAYNLIFNEWQKNANQTMNAEILSRSALLDYLKVNEYNYWVELDNGRKSFNGKQMRCIGLQISKLPPDIKEIAEGWKNTHEYNSPPGEPSLPL